MVTLDEACEFIADGTHFSPKNSERGERLYLTSKNVRENRLDLSDLRYIAEEDHQSIYTRCPVRKGDVLYVKDGANAGLAALNTLVEPFSLLSSVAVLRGKADYIDNRFLAFFLNTSEGRTRMLSMVSGVAITRLTLTKIHQAEIPVPAPRDPGSNRYRDRSRASPSQRQPQFNRTLRAQDPGRHRPGVGRRRINSAACLYNRYAFQERRRLACPRNPIRSRMII